MRAAPLAHHERGRGRPLVLLHAFPLSGAMWRAQVDAFAARRRVIAPDLPGFGASARLERPSIPAMAQAVLGLLDALRIHEPVVVGGLSMGGYVVFEIVRQAPHRVQALLLWSTRAAADTAEQRAARLQLIERIRREGFAPIAPTLLPKLVGDTTRASRPAVVEAVSRLMQQAEPGGVIDALQAMADRRDARELLGAIACPALVLAGAEDTLIPPAEAQAMVRQMPQASGEVIPASGHLINLEQPAPCQAAVERFLERVARA